ncbi:MAG: hypothetical protein KAS70_04060 [Planctomycetes bacterium]|nr:hypothetical protein [Planctomycetota bacterium]
MTKNLKWRCESCGYTVEEKQPPENCPACKQKCKFANVTCYTPDCGGPGNIDPNLYDRKEKKK